MSQAMDFIVRWFGASEEPVFLSSFKNDDCNDPRETSERHVTTRDSSDVLGFIKKWDRKDRGVYFCASTITAGKNRSKDTVAEICGLWADIDYKDVLDDHDSIMRRLLGLRFPPTIIVSSGNGLHLYWPFKEALRIDPKDEAQVEAIEEPLKLLCDLVGGDYKVCHIASLLRLPGSHNTKYEQWKDVEILHQSDAHYELDDLWEMLSETAPIILRKDKPKSAIGELNPFSELAATMGFKAPIDVAQRLTAMQYMAGGDASIHATQVSVTASLLNAGIEIDQVVDTVIRATRVAAGEYGTNWHWKREENTIRRMCETWIKKHPAVKKTQVATNAVKAATATVHSLDDARVKKEQPNKPAAETIVDRTNAHIMIGATLLKHLGDSGTPILLVRERLWRYRAGIWIEMESKSALDSEIEACIRGLGQNSTLKLVAETRGWIFRNPDIYHDEIRWDDHGKISVRGGLICPKTLELVAALPEHHITARIECDYEPSAVCPIWLQMLDSTFADREKEARGQTIGLIQEILGCAMIEEKSKALSRALIFHGLSNTGKTDLIKTISGLLTDRPISTPLGVLDGTHGLMEFTRNAPWVLHEAFDSQKWHFSATVKSILSGDPVQINVKNGPLTTRRIRQAVIWGTNVPPQFKEATRAIINRMIVVSCHTVFDPKIPIGVALLAQAEGFAEPSELILAREKPGLLNWALAGLRRALERGYFQTTTEMDATLETVRIDSNIVAGFLDECAQFGPSYMISTSDFCAAFSVWWNESKGEDRHVPSNESIGRALVAYGDPRIACGGKLRDTRHRYYAGLHLNSVGLTYWSGASMEGLARGKTARTSRNQNEVNRYLPPIWEQFPAIEKIRKLSDVSSNDSKNGPETEPSSVIEKRDSSPRF